MDSLQNVFFTPGILLPPCRYCNLGAESLPFATFIAPPVLRDSESGQSSGTFALNGDLIVYMLYPYVFASPLYAQCNRPRAK